MDGGLLSHRLQRIAVTDLEFLSRFGWVIDLDSTVNTAVAILFVSRHDYDFAIDDMALNLPWPKSHG